VNTPATRTLTVCGWTPEAAEALAALSASGRFHPVGVADPSGAALVQARRDTVLPCFQQVRQFLITAEYDVLLVSSPQAGAGAALAASRGADLLLLPEACDVETLEAAAEAARRHGVRLTLLRPETHDPGLADLASLLASPEWAPHYLDITVEGPTDIERLLGTAIAHTSTLEPHHDGRIRAQAWPSDGGATARAMCATLEAAGRQVRISARHAPDAYLRITGDAPAGAFELRVASGEATLTYTTSTGERIQYQPASVDHWTAEATRAASADDTARARAQASILDAIARSILTGEVQATNCCAKPDLRIIEGRGEIQSRRGNLRLVVS